MFTGIEKRQLFGFVFCSLLASICFLIFQGAFFRPHVPAFTEIDERLSELVGKPVALNVAPRSSLDPGECCKSYFPVGFFSKQIQLPESDLSVSECLHVLYYHGLGEPLGHASIKSTDDLLLVLLDSEKAKSYFSYPPIIKTRYGLRFSTTTSQRVLYSGGLESHRDQGLATLAKIGVPLKREVLIDGEIRTVKGFVIDSMANLSIRQRELSWTLEALAIYLAPQRVSQWKNKLGETLSFDGLFYEIASRDLSKSSCGGLHELQAVAVLLNCDSQFPILSQDARKDAFAWLSEKLVRLSETQIEGGGWSNSWFMDTRPELARVETGTLDQSLAVTGHVGELLMINSYPVEGGTPEIAEFYRYLLTSTVDSLRQPNHRRNICTNTHALVVLRHFHEDRF